ncbi:MAG: hypothetical protein Q8P41_12170 [Pseudomonadota bacterium]|nr:hypothetical protein [Pseudomonadota bacterium]
MHTLLLLLGLAFAGPPKVVVVTHPLVRALELPISARAVRHAGVPEADVRVALGTVHTHGLHAWDLVVVFEDAHIAMRKYGPLPHFGVFVISQLDRGMRGPTLADAIYAEHVRWGHDRYQEKDKDWNPGHGYNDERHGGKHLSDAGHGPGNSGKARGYGNGKSGHGKSNGNGKGNGKDNGKGKH